VRRDVMLRRRARQGPDHGRLTTDALELNRTCLRVWYYRTVNETQTRDATSRTAWRIS